MLSWTKYLATLMSELDDFFDEAEHDQSSIYEARRIRLESALLQTVLWDHQPTIDRILYGPMDMRTYNELLYLMYQNLARPDERGSWTQTEMAKFIKSFTHETND